jgi:NAD(P)-dependent dehydrogenase (short-subunit alcohol dehydrogenase family)
LVRLSKRKFQKEIQMSKLVGQSLPRIEGKVAVITGGTSGIGLATAQRFVNEGAHVFIVARRQEGLDKAVALIGNNVTPIQADVTRTDDLDRLYHTVRQVRGHLDVVVANAGRGAFSPLTEIGEEQVDEVFDLNLKAVLFTVQKALPLMRDGGSIILTSSIASVKGFPGRTAYAAAKAGLRAFARVWTTELKGRKIRTNVLTPGPVNTPQTARLPREAIDQVVSSVPLGRIAEADEIANAALFLASDESAFVTGIELFADGGAGQV